MRSDPRAHQKKDKPPRDENIIHKPSQSIRQRNAASAKLALASLALAKLASANLALAYVALANLALGN